jgi:hypothetical protein
MALTQTSMASWNTKKTTDSRIKCVKITTKIKLLYLQINMQVHWKQNGE